MKTKFKILILLCLSMLITSFITKNYSKKINNNIECMESWSCANCKKILYQTFNYNNPRPSMEGCSKSYYGHNWAYQGCFGRRIFKCRRCNIKLKLESEPANISSDNCKLNDDDYGRRHNFYEIK